MKWVSTVQPQTPCHAMHVHLAGNCTLSVIASDTDTYIYSSMVRNGVSSSLHTGFCVSLSLPAS